jgi:hypothetical protein
MEKQGSAFGINSIAGMLIATVLLLAILAGLTVAGIVTQQATAQQSYEIKDQLSIQMIGADRSNEEHVVIHGAAVGGDTKHKYKFEN